TFFSSQNVQHRRKPIYFVLFQYHFVFPERIQQIFVSPRQILSGEKLGVIKRYVRIVVSRRPVFLFLEIAGKKAVIRRGVFPHNTPFSKSKKKKRGCLDPVPQGFLRARLL